MRLKMTGKGCCFHCILNEAVSHDRVARGHKTKIANNERRYFVIFCLNCNAVVISFQAAVLLILNAIWFCFLKKYLWCAAIHANISTGWLIFRGVCQTTSNRKSEAIMWTNLLLCSSTARPVSTRFCTALKIAVFGMYVHRPFGFHFV